MKGRIRIRINQKTWIRIHIRVISDENPQHWCFLLDPKWLGRRDPDPTVNIVIFYRLTKSTSRSIIRIGTVLGPAPGLPPPPPYTIAPFCTPTSRPHPRPPPPPHLIVPPKWQKDPVPNRTQKMYYRYLWVILLSSGVLREEPPGIPRADPPGVPCPDPPGVPCPDPPGVPCPDPPGASPGASPSSSSSSSSA